ncbi:hypothetical protein ykris0001_4580 [Yersinia kristensenii ATCC 33638]|nr:hypothetical protein ykris0001_4580 [Yersinia kristensenii ATCC 33638]
MLGECLKFINKSNKTRFFLLNNKQTTIFFIPSFLVGNIF